MEKLYIPFIVGGMSMSFTSILLNIRSKLLFLPIFYGLLSFILAILSLKFDTFITSDSVLITYIPAIFLTDLDLAQMILSTISASLLTMTTITFSSIMIVLTTFLSQFSPRTLQNFISDKSTQRVLGIFVSGFIYSIILLLLLRESETKSLFFTPTLGVIFAIICLVVFIFFLNHVSSWIQVSNLIHNITSIAINTILKDYDNLNQIVEDAPWEDWEMEELISRTYTKIHAPKSGYINLIDSDGIVKKASDEDCIVKIEVKLGDYIDKDTHLYSIWNLQKDKCDRYLAFITIGPEKAPLQDVEFGLIKLVEIALRALSPAINDPNTAISCIHQLSRILAKLGQKHLPKAHHNDDKRNLRLIIEKPTFKDFLYKSFYQIRHYGSSDISVLAAMIEALQYIAKHTDEEVKETIWQFSMYIVEGIEKDELLSLDKDYLNVKIQQLMNITGHSNTFKRL